jgi:hypothetical protein
MYNIVCLWYKKANNTHIFNFLLEKRLAVIFVFRNLNNFKVNQK